MEAVVNAGIEVANAPCLARPPEAAGANQDERLSFRELSAPRVAAVVPASDRGTKYTRSAELNAGIPALRVIYETGGDLLGGNQWTSAPVKVAPNPPPSASGTPGDIPDPINGFGGPNGRRIRSLAAGLGVSTYVCPAPGPAGGNVAQRKALVFIRSRQNPGDRLLSRRRARPQQLGL
jgi:hypothetical protein